ncbi:MAG: glucose-1-phosphate adenylyltransferase [Thermoguttaceae bacterium]|nr:glucose-1-phosphate adenylyltransferase [Thermoguttaceae bacterium]
MREVITLVLGGGRGTRLYPLTKYRSKPAVPIAGNYRLIDIPLSNCINSGLNRVYVLTQFNSASLHRHIRSTYSFDVFNRGFVEILAAQQTNERSDWYQGTADAVRQNLRHIMEPGIRYVLILSGDQLYRMNFGEMLATHEWSGADVTIASVPVYAEEASGLGVMRVDDNFRVQGFLEKPQTKAELDMVRTDPKWIDGKGIESRGRDCLANMGIYLFNRDTLVKLLEKTPYQDFGKEIFPAAIRSRHVQLHLYDGYWEDIGTIRSFYNANLELAHPEGPFSLFSPASPIYSRPRFLPPSRLDNVQVRSSIIANGCIIEEGAKIENSIIGVRGRIGKNVTIRNSIIMGSDWYDEELPEKHRFPLRIGDGTLIDGAIVDKNCRIGKNVQISNALGVESTPESEWGMIRDGVVVVAKNAVLPDNWNIQ